MLRIERRSFSFAAVSTISVFLSVLSVASALSSALGLDLGELEAVDHDEAALLGELARARS